MKEENKPYVTYTIPENFMDAGTVFGGKIRLRNFIEAFALTVIAAWVLLQLHMPFDIGIITACVVLIPIFIFGIVGLHGESLTQFIYHFIKFYGKEKKKLGAPTNQDKKRKERKKSPLFLKLEHNFVYQRVVWFIDKKLLSHIHKRSSSPKEVDYPLPITMTGEELPIKKIQNGIIYLKDNSYVKFVEILPAKFLDENAKNNIIYAFASYLKISPVKLHMKVINIKATLQSLEEKLEKKMEEETNDCCRELQKDYLTFMKKMSEKDPSSKRFYLIFKYQASGVNRNSEQDAIYYLHNAVNTAQRYLEQCGNEIVTVKNENDFMYETLYMLLNRKTQLTEPFQHRVKEVINYYVPHLGNHSINHIPATELITAKEADFTHPDYILWDGTFYSHYIIASEGYPTNVVAGWLSFLINAGVGIDVDIYADRADRKTIKNKVGQKIRINYSKLKDTSDTNVDHEIITGAIKSGYYIKQGLAKKEDFYYMNILITVSADTLSDLQWKCQELEHMAMARDIGLLDCKYKQKRGFLSALPIASLDQDLYKCSKRNVLTFGLASCYPYITYEMSDDDGILIGQNKFDGSLSLLDLFNTKLYKNGNIALFGGSGSGKTYTMQVMATRMRRMNIQVFIIAPLKGHEVKRACLNIGGEFISYTLGGSQCINIMDISKKEIDIEEVLDGASVQNSFLAAKIQQLHIFFQLLIPDITNMEEQYLEEAFITCYKRKGITFDNESLWDDIRPNKYRKMPILSDLYEVLIERESTRRIADNMYQLIHGSAATIFNGQTNVDLSNKYIVVDISKLTGKYLPLGMFVILDYIWNKIKEDRTRKKCIFLDELWHLIGANANTLAANFVLEIFKIIRGYGGAAICSTQDLNDYFALNDGIYGKGIINNCNTKIVLSLEQEEAERAQEIIKLSDSEVKMITHFERGQALICKSNGNIAVNICASQKEHELITTDRKELEKIYRSKKEEKKHETPS